MAIADLTVEATGAQTAAVIGVHRTAAIEDRPIAAATGVATAEAPTVEATEAAAVAMIVQPTRLARATPAPGNRASQKALTRLH